jgi:predicted CoA-binding protein
MPDSSLPTQVDHDHYSDAFIRDVLSRVETIALVGASGNWNRPSYFVMKYLQAKGYRVIPVNPKSAAAGETILGETCYASLADIPEKIDMVDIFRSSAAAGPITDEAIETLDPDGARVVWMQIGVRNDAAAERAAEAGATMVMNRCPKIEYSRLWGELSWGGFNSNVISARRRKAVWR